MGAPRRKCTFVVGLVALLVMGVALPGQAAYTKAYSFWNVTGDDQSSVRAFMSGLESINAAGAFVFPSTWYPPTIGYAVMHGVFSTKLTCDGPPRPPGTCVVIAWHTADASCRLRDLRWGGGQSIVPTQGQGVPGGGMVFYDPDTGCLTVVITNDNPDPDQVITLSDSGFAISAYEIAPEGLADLLDVGLVELRVASIDEDIDVLLADIACHATELPSPSVNSVRKKLERAAAYKHDGLTECLGGDLARALFLWEKAAHQIENFISEVTNISDKGNLAPYLYDRWIVSGGGEIATAPEILDALLALPEGQPLQSLLPPGTPPPAPPGLDPLDYVVWPVDQLYPGQFTAFVVCGLDEGAGFVMGGSVLDEDGNVVVDWLEQSVAEPAVLDTEPPVITSAAATPDLWPPEHEMVEMALDVTVSDTDNGYAIWYVADVESNQPELGTGDGDYAPDWVLDPDDLQSLWLRAERSGNHPTETRVYTITLMAIDTAGNLSEPCYLDIRVDHDEGG